jgi:hypothetical protein
MIRLFVIACLLHSCSLFGQKAEFAEYDWNTFPAQPVSDTIQPVNGCLITLERRINEFYLNKDDEFEEISIYHRKVRVESHDAINRFNKIYIPVSNAIEVLAVKARFVSPNGKITEVPKESIKQIENLENKGSYQTFAIEGVELGGEIEYYYKVRKRLNAYGSVTVQSSEPKTNVEIIFAFPSRLKFLTKSYNGFPQFVETSDTVSDKSYLIAKVLYISPLTEENYSAYEANQMRFEFTITHNTYSGVLRLYSFSKVSQNVYNNLYSIGKPGKSAVIKALKQIKTEGRPTEEKVRTLENWLKSEMLISEDLSGEESIENMLRLKQASQFGITKLFVAFLLEMQIRFEMVLTCDQTERRFDPDFNGWNYLNDYLFYFPDLDKYIVPDNTNFRLGLIPSYYQGSFGLFLQPLTYGNDIKTLAYEVRKIPLVLYKENADSLNINLNLNLDKMNVDADIRRVFGGELASSFQSFWKLTNADKQKELVSSMFNMGTQNTAIRSFSTENDRPEDIAVHPFVWNVKLTANSLVELAGDDIILKIGETIGEQSQLYQVTQRTLPVYVGSLHNYYRKIVFRVPEGYSVSNLENLRMKVEMVRNNQVSCCFISDYELLGNLLTIYSTEFYSEMEYPKNEFEAFRDVINTAADFNKKTILLTKN